MMIADNFKDRLKEAIGGESNRSFAQKCDISEMTLRRYLSGDTFPPLDTLEKIAEVSGYSLAWLASGNGPMKGFAATYGLSEDMKNGNVAADPAPVFPPNYIHVPEETAELLGRLVDENTAKHGKISGDKMLLLMTSLYRVYSQNFHDDEEFRRDSVSRTVEAMVKLALPEK